LVWESQELEALEHLLSAPPYVGRLGPLARLEFTVRDLYSSTHWALVGEPPGFDTPDEDVYLTGRNIILLSKAAIYCSQHRIGRIALGLLSGNPFPDATSRFFEAMTAALSLGLSQSLKIEAPFASMDKPDVIRLGLELGVPLELTLSCMNPQGGRHCGRCSKCRERRDAFRAAGAADPTVYASAPIR
jgi:7-cyano-7-deazaguanine synthase